LLACLLLFVARPVSSDTPTLELFPKHFLLHPGERIHYQVYERSDRGQPRNVEAKFVTENPSVVRVEPTGILEALRPGRTDLVVRTPTADQRMTIEVAGLAQPPMTAVPYASVHEISAKEVLFVGHANLDGFDHTAVAKPGIDQLVQDAKRNGQTVVYWVSEEYPDWYTADRHPDYAIISEGQEHQIRFNAQRVVFTGGDFMLCLLRNVQMTLHGMLTSNVARQIDFILPAQAIWVGDVWDGTKRFYPAPSVLLKTLFARRADDAHRYDEVVVPFLNRTISEFPVLGYPANPPAPSLTDLLSDWSVVVRFGDRFERVYRRAESDKTVLVQFQGM
jgi:hypothetical protein